jgi:Uma2 family endonuclease
MYSMREELPEQRTFTVDDVYRMVDAGIIEEDEHVELLDGVLLVMSPQGPAHSALTVHLRRRLERLLGDRAHLRDHSNLRLDNHNLPEPDVAVVVGHELDYLHRLPTAADVLLVVEVSVTSQRRDRKKALLYARTGVPEYWILDVPARTLTLHRGPTAAGYTSVDTLDASAEVGMPQSDARWPVADLLP